MPGRLRDLGTTQHDDRMVAFGDERCHTLHFWPDRMGTVYLALDRVSGDPSLEWSRTVPIPSPTGREVGHP